jgi:hypothetical protein
LDVDVDVSRTGSNDEAVVYFGNAQNAKKMSSSYYKARQEHVLSHIF